MTIKIDGKEYVIYPTTDPETADGSTSPGAKLPKAIIDKDNRSIEPSAIGTTADIPKDVKLTLANYAAAQTAANPYPVSSTPKLISAAVSTAAVGEGGFTSPKESYDNSLPSTKTEAWIDPQINSKLIDEFNTSKERSEFVNDPATNLPNPVIKDYTHLALSKNNEYYPSVLTTEPDKKFVDPVTIGTTADIPKDVKLTLANYAAAQTAANPYPVSSTPKLISADVKTKVPGTSPNIAPIGSYDHDLPPTKTNTWIDPQINLDLTNAFKTSKSRNELLNNPVDDKPNEVVGKYASAILSKNRFSVDKTYINPKLDYGKAIYQKKGEAEAYFSKAIQYGATNDANQSNLGTSGADPGTKRNLLHRGKLFSIGTLLTMRSCGELGPLLNNTFNPGTFGNVTSALLPGLSQLGIPAVALERLDVDEIVRDIINAEVVGTGESAVDEFSKDVIDAQLKSSSPTIPGTTIPSTWGALNNPNDTYSGMDAIGMQLLSVAMLVAVTVVMGTFGLLLAVAAGSSTAQKSKGPTGRPKLGEYISTSVPSNQSFFPPIPLNLNSVLGLVPVAYPYKDSVLEGALVFYGFKKAGENVNFLNGLQRVAADSPAYYTIMSRSLVRASIMLVEKVKNMSVASLITGIAGLVDFLRSSRLVKITNLFASMGSLSLTLAARNKASNGNEGSWTANTPNFSVMNSEYSKISTGHGVIPWRNNSSKSLLLLPHSIRNAQSYASNLGGNVNITPGEHLKSGESITKISQAEKYLTSEKRIPADKVREIEAKLDAEFMPFYFHDLRTGEILSFHAFITSMNDSFKANYDSNESYGRMDPVKIYKSTNRSISLAFKIVSLDDEDFKSMWEKINKLTTLIYPQWSAGKLLASSDNKYRIRQPFSQAIAASPLIRLRLGDLFKSNYSKFALARLFGAIDENATINDTVRNGQITDEDIKKYNNLLSYPESTPGGDLLKWKIDFAANINVINFSNTALELGSIDLDKYLFKVVPASSDNGRVTVSVQEVDKENNPQLKNNDISRLLEMLPIGTKLSIEKRHLITTKETIKQIRKLSGQATPSEYETELLNFMSEKDNTLVRSFKNTTGKGLAGVIESMDFDWYSQTLWEILPGQSAPKMCTVSISFAPIHDIAPGLDHHGYNRAEIYNVGNGHDPWK